MTNRWIACVLGVVFVVSAGASLRALNVPTHRLINLAAAGVGTSDQYSDTFDRYLRESLGLATGRDTVLQGPNRTAEDLLAEGGEREDDGSRFSTKARFYRHFHNPLFAWDEAGLRTRYPFHLLPHQYTSSVRWMQTANQTLDDGGAEGGQWAWQNARRLHYLALTTENAREREAKTADLFRAVGQIMHLVVDASVPEHGRNDPHPFGTFSREVLRSRTAGNYEYWVSNEQARLGNVAFIARYLSNPIGVDARLYRILLLPGESIAKVPVARLLDTDSYRREAPDPNVTLSGPIGIAEFANANFFSEDTLFGVDTQDRPLPFPRREDLIRRSDLAPLNPRIRAYLQKPPGQGLATNFALAECRFEGRAARLSPYPCMDEAVWEETATHMLPRAVGYARGVLDYFFRGSLRVHSLYTQAGDAFIRIENLTDEEMEGVFEVYARPMARTPDESREKVVVVNGGAATSLGPKATVTLPVTLLPAQHPTASQILVFRGRLGLEQDAVAAQVFDVPHVLITQTGDTAHMSESCSEKQLSANIHTKSCNWVPSFHEVTGEFVTDITVPVIARVSAGSALRGPVDLELDGVPIPGRVWQRQGTEPDPRRFRLRGGATHGLMVTVQLVNGAVVSTPMAVLLMATGVAQKLFTWLTYWHYQDPPWYVEAERTARIRVTAHPSYRTLSISGYPNPTNIVTDRFGDSRLLEEIFVGNAISSETWYRQRWIDHAQLFSAFPPGGPVILNEQLKALFDPLPFGPVPVVPWEAVVERVYEPADLEFLKTFVTSAPPPRTFTVSGRPQSGT